MEREQLVRFEVAGIVLERSQKIYEVPPQVIFCVAPSEEFSVIRCVFLAILGRNNSP